MSKISSLDLDVPVLLVPAGQSVHVTNSTEKVPSLDLGELVSPGSSIHSANPTNLAHKLAVRTACHMVKDRRPEARAFLEVETCIRVSGAMPSKEHTIEISMNDETYKFELHLSKQYNRERALILDWVGTPRDGVCSR